MGVGARVTPAVIKVIGILIATFGVSCAVLRNRTICSILSILTASIFAMLSIGGDDSSHLSASVFFACVGATMLILGFTKATKNPTTAARTAARGLLLFIVGIVILFAGSIIEKQTSHAPASSGAASIS
jgi:hypothetical protein